jgi:hypothetical protein
MDIYYLIYCGIWLGIGMKVSWVLWEYSVKFGAYIIRCILDYLKEHYRVHNENHVRH